MKASDNRFYVKFMQLEIGLLNRLYNVKLHVIKSERERTYNCDNENILSPILSLPVM